MSPIFGLQPRAEWPLGIGESYKLLQPERAVPTVAEPTWTVVSQVSGAEGGSCLPPVTKIALGNTERTVQLYQRAVEGPDICAIDTLAPWQIGRQMDAAFEALTEYVRVEWEIRFRHDYLRACKLKVECDSAGLTDGTTVTESAGMPTSVNTTGANSVLTQGFLDVFRPRLLRDGALGVGMTNGAATLVLMTSAESSERILNDIPPAGTTFLGTGTAALSNENYFALQATIVNAMNSQFKRVMAADAPALLKAYGVDKVHKGFAHVIDPYPMRFNCASNAYTEVPAFLDGSATRGRKASPNPAYATATHEVSVIYDPSVMIERIPTPRTSLPGKIQFDPQNHTGEFFFRVIPDRDCNPDGNIGYHRARLLAAPEVRYPERGVAFIHKRPAAPLFTSSN